MKKNEKKFLTIQKKFISLQTQFTNYASVVELVDTLDSKSGGSNPLRVQVPSDVQSD